MRIWGQTMLLPVVGVQAKRWQHPAPCAPGDGHTAWCASGSMWEWACPAPQPTGLLAGSECPKCCLSPWLLASGHGGHAVVSWSSGAASWIFLSNSARSPPRKILERSGFGETPGPFLPLLPISCCLGSGHTLDNQVGSHSPRSGELTRFQHYAKALNAGKPDHAHHVKIKGELKASRP